MPGIICVPAVILFILILSSLRVLKEYQRGVVFRLGKVIGLKGPGLIFVFPIIDSLKKVDLRVIAMDVPPQDVITKDNVSVKVNAVTYYRVIDPKKAVLEVTNYMYATNQLAQTTLRSVWEKPPWISFSPSAMTSTRSSRTSSTE